MRTHRVIVQKAIPHSSPKRVGTMFENVDSQPGSGPACPCCDVIVDASGELRLKIAGDWHQEDRDEQLLSTLRSVFAFGAPSYVDISGLGKVSREVREFLDRV